MKAPTTKAGASEQTDPYMDRLTKRDLRAMLRREVAKRREAEASDAATRAALKDTIKELEKAKATAGRLDPLSALAYQGLAYIVNDLDNAISKLSALAGEQE